MTFGLSFRAQLEKVPGGHWLVQSLNNLITGVTDSYHTQHNTDDTHGVVTATSYGGAMGVIALVTTAPALGGGAAPTVGTIGGSGPAAAAQKGWIKVTLNGTTAYLPYWT